MLNEKTIEKLALIVAANRLTSELDPVEASSRVFADYLAAKKLLAAQNNKKTAKIKAKKSNTQLARAATM